MMGGIGVCGRVLCCKSFLGEFQPVSIKMAKEQGLSLNPTKISGTCGRLMCCLKYEQEVYEQLSGKVPKMGAIVETPEGQGVVMEINVLRELVKVKLDKGNETDLETYKLSQIKVVKDAVQEEESDIDLESLKQLED
jgi:cell fate regulator YaaT (PSP1 superfamily)